MITGDGTWVVEGDPETKRRVVDVTQHKKANVQLEGPNRMAFIAFFDVKDMVHHMYHDVSIWSIMFLHFGLITFYTHHAGMRLGICHNEVAP